MSNSIQQFFYNFNLVMLFIMLICLVGLLYDMIITSVKKGFIVAQKKDTQLEDRKSNDEFDQSLELDVEAIMSMSGKKTLEYYHTLVERRTKAHEETLDAPA